MPAEARCAIECTVTVILVTVIRMNTTTREGEAKYAVEIDQANFQMRSLVRPTSASSISRFTKPDRFVMPKRDARSEPIPKFSRFVHRRLGACYNSARESNSKSFSICRSRGNFFDGSDMRWTRGALLNRRVHRNDRRARSRRPLPRCLDGKCIASLISSLRLVFVGRDVEPFQLAVSRLL
jgi:hypothetical protein